MHNKMHTKDTKRDTQRHSDWELGFFFCIVYSLLQYMAAVIVSWAASDAPKLDFQTLPLGGFNNSNWHACRHSDCTNDDPHRDRKQIT